VSCSSETGSYSNKEDTYPHNHGPTIVGEYKGREYLKGPKKFSTKNFYSPRGNREGERMDSSKRTKNILKCRQQIMKYVHVSTVSKNTVVISSRLKRFITKESNQGPI
jgi:hypothetical protein